MIVRYGSGRNHSFLKTPRCQLRTCLRCVFVYIYIHLYQIKETCIYQIMYIIDSLAKYGYGWKRSFLLKTPRCRSKICLRWYVYTICSFMSIYLCVYIYRDQRSIYVCVYTCTHIETRGSVLDNLYISFAKDPGKISRS